MSEWVGGWVGELVSGQTYQSVDFDFHFCNLAVTEELKSITSSNKI